VDRLTKAGIDEQQARAFSDALAATVFRYRAQEGRNSCGRGIERRSLPVSFGTKHGIENNQQLAHAGGECAFGVLTPGAQLQIKAPDNL